MSKHVVVELVCRAEDELVGKIETQGDLSAQTIQRGLEVVSRKRCPRAATVRNGVQLTCGHCYEPLFFRAKDGELFAAMPGSVKAQP